MPTGSGWKNFTSASLTADDVNGYLMSQSVMVFDSSTTRAAILVAPTEGMLTYLKDTNLLQYYTGSAYANVGGGGGVTSFTSSSGLSTNTSATGAVSVTNTGVTSNVAGTGISVSGATGAVTVANTGVTSLVAGTNITLSGSTGAVTINASGGGVTSAVAGTGVSVSGATGAVTISIGQSVATSAKPTFAGVDLTAYSTYPAGDNSRFVFGPNSTFAGYLHIGATTDKTANNQAQVISTDGNLHMDSGRNKDIYLNYYSAGRSIQAYGNMNMNNYTITANKLSLTYPSSGLSIGSWSGSPTTWGGVEGNRGYLLMHNAASDTNIYLRSSSAGYVMIGANSSNTLQVGNGSTTIGGNLLVSGQLATSGASQEIISGGPITGERMYVTNWFRAYGTSGLYFEDYAGGWRMTDPTWVRSYNDKNIYTAGEIRSGQRFSGNGGRQRGSYGAISIGSNGVTNTWNGIEFESDAQTFMVQGDNYSGMYRNNNAWNWLFDYSTLSVGSDERYKREIEPLSLGLNFIESLEPISYLRLTETPDDDPETTEDGYYYGFTAQNVRTALDSAGETRDVKIHDIGGPNMGLVACTEDAVYDRQYIGVTEFIAPIVQAIKELSDKVKALEGAQ